MCMRACISQLAHRWSEAWSSKCGCCKERACRKCNHNEQTICEYFAECRALKVLLNGRASNGGVSRSGLVLPFLSFLSFLGLSRFFRDFPDLLGGDSPGIFPICLFLLSRPISSTNEEQSRNRDTIWTFPENNGKPPGLETSRFSFSQKVFKWEGLSSGRVCNTPTPLCARIGAIW